MLQNLILSEVGDVRAKYDVSDNAASRWTSKVDLAEAVGSTGVGAILGVGISGLVQVGVLRDTDHSHLVQVTQVMTFGGLRL